MMLRRRSGDAVGLSAHVKSVSWLFERTGRGAPTSGFGRYVLISAVGVFGFIGLLMASSIMPIWASVLRPTALVWFIVFGLLRITTFSGR